MVKIIPFGSGKGGVGKSLIVSNLAISLSKEGKTVVLIDMDLGGSNLHTFLGLKNNKDGLGKYFTDRDISLESLIVPCDYPRLYFIPGDNLLLETANHPFFMKKKFKKEIREITADYVLLDLGAGTSFNTIDYFLLSLNPVIVVTPEPTSLLNAYSLIKNSLFRIIIRSLPPKSEARERLKILSAHKMEGKDWTMNRIIEQLDRDFPSLTVSLKKLMERFIPQIVINMGRNRSDVELAAPLRKMCRKILSIELRFFGFIHYEENIYKAVRTRKPAIELLEASPFNRDISRLSKAIIAPGILPDSGTDDLENLVQYF